MVFTMSSSDPLTFRWLLLVSAVGLTVASDASPSDLVFHGDHDAWMTSFFAAVVAMALTVSMIVVMVACAQLCPCRDRFKNMQEEDSYFPNMDFPNPPRDVDLGLYPPVEGTPEHRITSFEPLPDVSTLMRSKKPLHSNTTRLRPKVSHVVRDRLDSEEDIDSRDNIQSKLDRLIGGHSTKQNFERSQLNYIKEIGSGWFGKILQGDGQGLLPGHKKTAAIIQILREDADKFDQYGFLQESAPYRDTEHQNVLRLLGHCVDAPPYLTVLELCVNGDLKMYLRNQRSNIETIDKQGRLLNFAGDIAAGLQALHQNNYVHRDLAIRNCLVTLDLTVKIGDYGLSEEMYKEDYYADPSGALVPIRWLAPEVISFTNGNGVSLRHITKDCNLWSFGVALWEIVTFGSLPYGDLTNDHVLKLVIFEQSVRLLRPEVPVSNLDRLCQLMELCWMAPAQRPSLRELRIMLLHLQSSKDELDTHAFDQKWNQLLPRHHHLHDSGMNNDIATIDAQDITVLPSDEDYPYRPGRVMGGRILDDFQALHEQAAARPLRMDSRFSELDPTLLVHSGQFQDDLFSWPKFDATGGLESKQSFPANELSLQAELGQEHFSPFRLANGDDEEYSDDRDAFVFVSLPPERNLSTKTSEADHGTRSGALGKHSPQQIHIAEVHRLPVDPQDMLSKEPLLDAGAPSHTANFSEVSSEDGAEELNRDEHVEDVAAASLAVVDGVAEGAAGRLPRSARKSLKDLDGSGSVSPDSATDFRPVDQPITSHASRTDGVQTALGSDLTFVGKPKTSLELNGEKENNNTLLANDQLISIPSELSLGQDQKQNNL